MVYYGDFDSLAQEQEAYEQQQEEDYRNSPEAQDYFKPTTENNEKD